MERDIMTKNNIEDTIYKEAFEKTYKFLYSGLSDNLEQDIFDLSNGLESLLTYYDNNYTGRGEISQSRIAAEIAATELVLLELKQRHRTGQAV